MSTKLEKIVIFTIFALLVVLVSGSALAEPALSTQEELGSSLYFDANLSNPPGQSCASCHDPGFGFADPDRGKPTSEGVILGLFGNRNSPISAYAMYAPVRYFDEVEGLWIGGQFWDSRATGDFLGDPLADQAIGPFENPVEMANTREGVLQAIMASNYYWTLFVPTCGEINLMDPDAVDASYHCVGLAIAAFERTALFAQFNSKYDYYLQACLAAGGDMHQCAVGAGPVAATVGQKIFSKKEWHGMQLFMAENNNNGILEPGEGAMCSACHVADWIPADDYKLSVVVPDWAPAGWIPPVFTDFTYDNLGVPKNPDNPFYYLPPEYNPLGMDLIDYGLGAVLGDPDENGKFKVMTLRNIHLSGPYSHNGFFKSLEEITDFYNSRDVADWPAAEIPDTVNVDELGNLGLSDTDIDHLVKFMKTLSDGFVP